MAVQWGPASGGRADSEADENGRKVMYRARSEQEGKEIIKRKENVSRWEPCVGAGQTWGSSGLVYQWLFSSAGMSGSGGKAGWLCTGGGWKEKENEETGKNKINKNKKLAVWWQLVCGFREDLRCGRKGGEVTYGTRWVRERRQIREITPTQKKNWQRGRSQQPGTRQAWEVMDQCLSS